MSMTRRTALKSLGAFLLAPVIRLDLSHERDLSALVGEFCATDKPSVYDLSQPWEFAGDSVASDARALIRVPGLRYAKAGSQAKIPDTREVFNRCWHDAAWKRLPPEKLMVDPNGTCPYCIRNHCTQCDGEGFVILDDQWRSDLCDKCGTEGYIAKPDCEFCHGSYKSPLRHDVSMKCYLSARYVRLVRRIPGVMYSPRIAPGLPVLFRGDGGIVAMVMPEGNT